MIDADPQLVESDENYRKEKILELVKTSVWNTVETAVALAEQEGVSSSKVMNICVSRVDTYFSFSVLDLECSCSLVVFEG